jgi:hypothetical protein
MTLMNVAAKPTPNPSLKRSANVGQLIVVTNPILFIGVIMLSVTPVIAQAHFYLEKPWKRPAKIPDRLLPLLRDEIKSRCRDDAVFQGSNVRALFSASRITLNHHRALILRSNHYCLTGADNIWFWVFLRTGGGYRKVLFGGTISIDVLRTKTYGLRDIETNVATASTNYMTIYKFNGSGYKPRLCTETAMAERNRKPHRVPCRR